MRYHRATSVAEALAWLAEGAVPLAGGTVIVPEAIRAGGGPDVVDISRIAALQTVAAADGVIRIGALVTLAQLASLPVLAPLAALRAAAEEVANPHVRLRGTLGGNLGYRAPYPNLPPALIALDAVAVVAGAHGERAVAIADLVRRGVPPGSLITRVELPGDGRRSAFRKLAWRRSSGRTLVTVALGVTDDTVRVAVGGICQHAVRLPRVEALLRDQPWTPLVADEAARAAADDAPADVPALPASAYRRALVAAGVRRVMTELAGSHA